MSDISIIVKKQGTIFLAGPPLVKAAINQDVTAEELGGADLHCSESGVTDYMAQNDEHALWLTRKAISQLNWQKSGVESLKAIDPKPPRYDPMEIYGILPETNSTPFDIRQIIARIVDDSQLDEYRALYGTDLVTGWSHIEGYPVGIVANNGVLDTRCALKAANFIELCNQRGIPLVFLQNISGFMVGKEAEAEGIAKHGAKMVNAVATSTVPKYTILVGGSHGAGNYAMCGRAYNPRFLFSWPNSRISVMGGTQAAEVLAQVKTDQLKRNNKSWSQEEQTSFKQPILEKYEKEGHPFYASARLWDDGVILPHETRDVLARCLSVGLSQPIDKKMEFGVFRM